MIHQLHVVVECQAPRLSAQGWSQIGFLSFRPRPNIFVIRQPVAETERSTQACQPQAEGIPYVLSSFNVWRLRDIASFGGCPTSYAVLLAQG